MKKLIVTIFMALLSTQAFGADLCKVLASEYSEGTVKEVYSKWMRKGTKFNKWEQKQILSYMTHGDGYYSWRTDELITTFDQVVAEFSEGFDELHIALFNDENSGTKYTYVWSYPGDNEYGVWLDRNGKVLAEIQDGDLVVLGHGYCD